MSPEFSFVEGESTVVVNNKQMWQKLLNVILSERIILANKMTPQTCHHFVLPRLPEGSGITPCFFHSGHKIRI